MSGSASLLTATVPESSAGRRFDAVLAELFPDYSRSRLAAWIKSGDARLDGREVRPRDPVHGGETVTLMAVLDVQTHSEPEDIALDVLYEDAHVIVINKPPGLVIHPAAGNPDGTLVNALLAHCDDLSGVGGVERPGIVHRLDKDTSGVLVAAKTDLAHRALSLSFRWRTTDKRYLAVVYGVPRTDEGVVDAPIARHPTERTRMAVVPDGRAARTVWWLKERFAGSALLECRLVTGRTHQVRVHMAHAGHALVGDPLYAGRQWRAIPDEDVATRCRDFPRQALHAWRLTLTHPASGEVMTFEAPLPADIEDLLSFLRLRAR